MSAELLKSSRRIYSLQYLLIVGDKNPVPRRDAAFMVVMPQCPSLLGYFSTGKGEWRH